MTADEVAEVHGHQAVCDELRKHIHVGRRRLSNVSPEVDISFHRPRMRTGMRNGRDIILSGGCHWTRLVDSPKLPFPAFPVAHVKLVCLTHHDQTLVN